MKRIILAALVGVFAIIGMAESGHAYDEKGIYVTRGRITCAEYLDSFTQATLTAQSRIDGPSEFLRAAGFIFGFITAHNVFVANGKQDIAVSMVNNDLLRWLASWCRENPSKKIATGPQILIKNIKD